MTPVTYFVSNYVYQLSECKSAYRLNAKPVRQNNEGDSLAAIKIKIIIYIYTLFTLIENELCLPLQ